MLNIIEDIQNDPITGLARKADLVDFDWKLKPGYIKLQLLIVHFNASGEEVSSKGLRGFDVELTADDSILVNPATGQYVDADFPGAIGEYSFFTMLAENGPIDIIGLIKSSIRRANSLGRFNV
jgi:hypothetical protein